MRHLAILAAAVLVAAGCNATLEGRAAPELEGAAWVLPDGSSDAVDLDGKWAVIAFFSPT